MWCDKTAAYEAIAESSTDRHCGIMSSSLTLKYKFSGDPQDDFGWLDIDVVGDKFSGKGGFWVQWQDVREFGEALATFPISLEAPLKAAWGYEPWEGDSLIVSLEIVPADNRGNLLVKVWLRDYMEPFETEPAECVRTSFTTNYPDLDVFRIAIAKLMERKSDAAVLLGR